MKKIFLYVTVTLACVIIPAVTALSIIFFLSTSTDFSISIIKKLGLVRTFIEAKNYQVENDIKREVERKTGISAYKAEYDRIKKDYDDKLLAYNSLNKTEDFEKIEKQIDALDDLEWEKAPENFKTEKDFDRFKEQKMKDLKADIKAIREYRDKNEDAIDKSEDEMESAKDLFEDADGKMKDKEDDAREIIEDRRGDFMNEIYSDIAKIEPALTESFNSLFIEKELKRIIGSYIGFFTSYFREKEAGNIYETRLNVESGVIENTKKVNLPPFVMSFIVKVNDNGVEKSKNLLSEVFVEIIRDTPGLKSPWVMSKIFSMSDSWIAEKVSGSFLKNTGLTYSDGVVRSGPVVLSGKKAEAAEKLMICMTAGRYLPFAATGISLILLFLLFILSGERKKGLRITGYVLKYPSAAVVIAGIAAMLLSLVPGLVLPGIMDDPVLYAFIDRTVMVVTLHYLIPLTAVFFLISLAGGFMVRIGKR